MALFKRKAVVKNQALPPYLSTWLKQSRWVLYSLISVYLIMVLASYTPTDPAWSHSSSSETPITLGNWGGSFGAWLADLLLYGLGVSAWWSVIFFAWQAINSHPRWQLRRLLRSSRPARWAGFVLFCIASSSFEAIRFHSLTATLPLAPGGILGNLIGEGLMPVLGFTLTSLLVFIGMGVAFSLSTGLSWLDAAEKTGEWIENVVLSLVPISSRRAALDTVPSTVPPVQLQEPHWDSAPLPPTFTKTAAEPTLDRLPEVETPAFDPHAIFTRTADSPPPTLKTTVVEPAAPTPPKVEPIPDPIPAVVEEALPPLATDTISPPVLETTLPPPALEMPTLDNVAPTTPAVTRHTRKKVEVENTCILPDAPAHEPWEDTPIFLELPPVDSIESDNSTTHKKNNPLKQT